MMEEMEVLGKRKVGRSKKTWRYTVRQENIRVKDEMVMDQRGRRKIIASPTPKE
jgi:hypothetical protein